VADVGVYRIVVQILTPATLVSTAVGQMFSPRIAAEDARGDHRTLGVMLKRVTYWNTAVSIPLFAVFAVLPVPLLGIFGPRYVAGAPALAILSIGQLLNTTAGPLGQVINMSGRPYVTMINNALVAAANIGMCLVLIPRYGLTGAALSTAIALTVVNLIKLFQVRAIFGTYSFRLDTAATYAAAAAGSAVAVPIAFVPTWPGPALQTLVASAALFAVYGAIVWLLGMSREDRALFEAARTKLRRRLRGRRRRRVNPQNPDPR
jgi:O-antigen/teichoic acid export membrane protein